MASRFWGYFDAGGHATACDVTKTIKYSRFPANKKIRSFHPWPLAHKVAAEDPREEDRGGWPDYWKDARSAVQST